MRLNEWGGQSPYSDIAEFTANNTGTYFINANHMMVFWPMQVQIMH